MRKQKKIKNKRKLVIVQAENRARRSYNKELNQKWKDERAFHLYCEMSKIIREIALEYGSEALNSGNVDFKVTHFQAHPDPRIDEIVIKTRKDYIVFSISDVIMSDLHKGNYNPLFKVSRRYPFKRDFSKCRDMACVFINILDDCVKSYIKTYQQKTREGYLPPYRTNNYLKGLLNPSNESVLQRLTQGRW